MRKPGRPSVAGGETVHVIHALLHDLAPTIPLARIQDRLRNPAILRASPERVRANLAALATTLDCRPARLVTASLRSHVLLTQSPATTLAKLRHGAILFGLALPAFVKIALAKPVLLNLSQQHLAELVTATQRDLGIEPATYLRMLTKHPTLATMRASRITANLALLSDELALPVPVLVKAAQRQPQILYQKPSTLIANVTASARALGCPLSAFLKAGTQHPALFYLPPATITAKVAGIARAFNVPTTDAATILLSFPAMVGVSPSTLAARVKANAAALNVPLTELRKACRVRPALAVLTPNNLAAKGDALTDLAKQLNEPYSHRRMLGDFPQAFIYSVERVNAMTEVVRHGLRQRTMKSLLVMPRRIIDADLRRLAILILACVLLPVLSWAACTNPAGAEGALNWNYSLHAFQSCDGTTWNTLSTGGSGATPTDRISTTNVASGANLGMAVADQGTISFTLGGTPGAAYLHPTLGLVAAGVSTTGTISGSTGYFRGNLGLGTTLPKAALHVSGGVIVGNGLQSNPGAGNMAVDNYIYLLGNDNTPGGAYLSSDYNGVYLSANKTMKLSLQDATSTTLYKYITFRMGSTDTDQLNIYGRTLAPVAGTTYTIAGATGSYADGTSLAFVAGTAGNNGYGAGNITFTPGATFLGVRGYSAFTAGNVGIGTVTPTAMLQVSGTFTVSNSTQVTTPSIYVSTGLGYVGIGTGAPSFTLNVYENTGASNVTTRIQNGTRRIDFNPYGGSLEAGYTGSYFTQLNLVNGGMTLIDTGNTGQTLISIGNGSIRTNQITSGIVNGTTYSKLQLFGNLYPTSTTTPAIDLQTFDTGGSQVSKLRIFNGDTGYITMNTSGGNVGIGTTAPSYTLHVSGSIGLPNNNNTSTSRLYLAGSDANHYLYSTGSSGNVTYFGEYNSSGTGGWQFVDTASATTRVNIQADGKVGVGITAPSYRLDVSDSQPSSYVLKIRNNANTSGPAGILVQAGIDSTNSGAPLIQFQSPNGTNLGSITQTGSGSAAYNTTSDRRLKENIVSATGGLLRLMQIPVVDFNFISDPSKTRVEGFIAQDVAKVFPEAVTKHDDGIKALTAKDTPWAMDYGRITPLIVKAVQELKAANDALVSQSATLRLQLKAANDNTRQLEERLDRIEHRLNRRSR